MATYTLISSQTVSSAVTSVTFSSIPQTYTDLIVLLSGRTDFAQVYGGGTLRFNGDTGSNYSWKRIYGDGTSAGSSGGTGTGIVDWDMNGSPTTANTFGSTQIYIPNYAGNSNKSCSIDYTVENNATAGIDGMVAGLWSNTSAITSISILSFTFATYYLQQYTTAYLYGISNA
jgi:hypothetical protein